MPSRANRRQSALVAGAILAILVGVAARYSLYGWRFCHPARLHVTTADEAEVRGGLPAVEDVSFRSHDGLVLRGFYVPSRNGAVVVMGHGLESNRMFFLPDVEMLARHGYGALFFDWRAHGESDGEVSTWGDREQDDLSSAIDYASSRPDVSGGRVAAMGFSIGASAVAMEAAHDPRVRAVVLEALSSSFADEMQSKMGSRGFVSVWPAQAMMRYYGVIPDHIRPIDHVWRISPRPILFIAGSRDEDTPPSAVERSYGAAREPKRLWVVEGAGHGEYEKVDPRGCEDVVTGFLDAALFADGSPR
jgi:pimeloyl-ACP methyl ester carboxylesterase